MSLPLVLRSCRARSTSTASQGSASNQLLSGHANLGRPPSVPCSNAATCWLTCLPARLLGRVRKGPRGARSGVCGHALEDSSSLQAGAVRGMARGSARNALHAEVFP